MSNIFSSDLFKYSIKKNADGSVQHPKILLLTRMLKKRGEITKYEQLKITPKFKEVSECSFTVYKENDGDTLPCFDKIKDNTIIKIEGYGLYQIKVTLHEVDSVYKEVTGQIMQACELGQADCKLEINTDADIERTDYNKNYPTVFYREQDHPEASLLHRILTYAPTYSIGYVDPSLYNIVREFSHDGTVYDFFNTISEEIGCIFVFSRYKREINVFDLEDHCTNPECMSRHIIGGECQKCHSSEYVEKGYGLDVSVYLGTDNIATEITDTIDADSIKNCFKLVAGDDKATNLIGQRLIGNSQYIWTFSDFEIEEFSDGLKERWLTYQPFVEQYQEEFDAQWDIYNDCVNQILYWESGKMPVVENPLVDSSNPLKTCNKILEEIVNTITYTAISSKSTVASTIARNVLNYAKLICPEGYEVEYNRDETGEKIYTANKNGDKEFTTFDFQLYIYLKNCKDEEDSSKDKYYIESGTISIPIVPGYKMKTDDNLFTTDYYLYLKQQVDYAYAKLDIDLEPKYDTDYEDGVENHLDDSAYYKNYFREYGINRLQSFKDAYEQCTVLLLEQNNSLVDGSDDIGTKYIKVTGVQSAFSLYNELSGRYIAFAEYIGDVIKEYTEIVEDYKKKKEAAKQKIDDINATCNLKTYLGEDLYYELLTFKREDSYENQNYSSDVVDEATLMSNIEEFIVAAKQEIAKACQPNHEVSISMAQLLSDLDYKDVFDKFALGNYVRSRINGEIVKLRVVSIPIEFDNIEQSSVDFSDTLVGNQQVYKMSDQIKQATSMATSFGFVQKQSEQNNAQLTSFETMFSNGLDASKNMIMNSENQDVIMDNHGLLGRELDENEGTYLPQQYRLNSKGLIFTNNNWATIKAALGQIYYNDEWRYGLIADCIVGNLIAGKQLEISDNDKSVVINSNGLTLDGAAITWKNKLPDDAVIGLKDFKTEVNTQLTIAGVTKIENDYVFSPKITGGYLYIQKDGCSVEIDPAKTYNENNDKVIHVKANNEDVFYVDRTGSAYMKAKIYATDGVFSGTINGGEINGGTINGSKITGSEITTSLRGRNVKISSGRIYLNKVRVDCGFLNANETENQNPEDQKIYSNTLNFSLDGSDAELGLRWYADNIGTDQESHSITICNKLNNKLHIGEWNRPIGRVIATQVVAEDIGISNRPIKNIVSTNIKSTDMIEIGDLKIENTNNHLYHVYSGDNITTNSPHMIYEYDGSTSDSCARFNLSPNMDIVGTIGTSDKKWNAMYSYAYNGTSDKKLKKNIKPIDEQWAESFINSLIPSSYKFKQNSYGKTHTGFVAQDVEKSILSLGMKRTDFAGLVKTPIGYDNPEDDSDNFEGKDENYDYALRYDDFIAPIVSYCQMLYKKYQDLEQKFLNLEKEV